MLPQQARRGGNRGYDNLKRTAPLSLYTLLHDVRSITLNHLLLLLLLFHPSEALHFIARDSLIYGLLSFMLRHRQLTYPNDLPDPQL